MGGKECRSLLIGLLIVILLILIGCKDQQSITENNTIMLSDYEPQADLFTDHTFYSLECLNNYYEYTNNIENKPEIQNITGYDDLYYYYIEYVDTEKHYYEHGIFPKCSFVQSRNQFSNILNSIRYPCCSQEPLLTINEPLKDQTIIRKAIEYMFNSNNVKEYLIKSITETDQEFFITVKFKHDINEGSRGGTKEGLAYFKVDKITGNIFETKADVEITNRWDAPLELKK